MYSGGWDQNRDRLGLPQQPRQEWTQIADYSPDSQPSHSRLASEFAADGSRVLMMAVRGLGVVCITMVGHPLTGKFQLRGARTFDKGEVGYAPGVI